MTRICPGSGIEPVEMPSRQTEQAQAASKRYHGIGEPGERPHQQRSCRDRGSPGQIASVWVPDIMANERFEAVRDGPGPPVEAPDENMRIVADAQIPVTVIPGRSKIEQRNDQIENECETGR